MGDTQALRRRPPSASLASWPCGRQGGHLTSAVEVRGKARGPPSAGLVASPPSAKMALRGIEKRESAPLR
eukprot:4783876-Pyramimonas_sp.AAC.1